MAVFWEKEEPEAHTCAGLGVSQDLPESSPDTSASPPPPPLMGWVPPQQVPSLALPAPTYQPGRSVCIPFVESAKY